MSILPYFYLGDLERSAEEYSFFRRCLPQLIDSDEITGDLEGKFVIFKDGWVYGMAAYETEEEAIVFGRRMLRGECASTWIVVQVDLEKHKVSALHLLSDALSDLELDSD